MAPQDEALQRQVAIAVQAAFVPAERLIASVVRNSPYGKIGDILARRDVQASLADGLASAERVASIVVRRAWEASGGPADSPVREQLLADVTAAYSTAQAGLEDAVRSAFASVAPRQVEPGITVPGEQPALDSARARGNLVASAFRAEAAKLGLRSRLSTDVAGAASQTAAVLAEGQRRLDAGEHVRKVWRSRKSPRTCRWCWQLDGMMLELDQQFPHGEPVFLPQGRTRRVATPSGARHYHRAIGQPIIMTHPPRPYMGVLLGPPRHPRCECWLELVTVTEEPPPPRMTEPPGERQILRASEVASLPAPQYNALTHFMRAAVHELGRLLRRLTGI
jgi:hypothetical protein